jgi:hypothetical protein
MASEILYGIKVVDGEIFTRQKCSKDRGIPSYDLDHYYTKLFNNEGFEAVEKNILYHYCITGMFSGDFTKYGKFMYKFYGTLQQSKEFQDYMELGKKRYVSALSYEETEEYTLNYKSLSEKLINYIYDNYKNGKLLS